MMRSLSIKSRIMLWYTLLLAALVCFIIPFIYYSMKSAMYSNTKNALIMTTAEALSELELEDGSVTLEEFKNMAETEFIIYDNKDTVTLETRSGSDLDSLPHKYGQAYRHVTENGDFMIYDQQIETEYNEEIKGWIRAYSSLGPVDAALKNLRLIIGAAIPFYFALAVLGGWLLLRKALSPVDRITRTAREIANGDLSKRLDLPETGDEVGRLASTFDNMIEKLETAFKKEKQFASDASHEMRTPISVIISSAEAALAGEKADHEYRETLRQILSESKRMGSMVSKLLLLSRGDDSKYKYEFEELDLGMLAEEVAGQMQESAATKAISIIYEPKENAKIKADQTLMVRMLINLIDNSIKYGKEGGTVRISFKNIEGGVEISVEDNGIGISPEDLPFVFDRFYRADKSRSSEGNGLGLSIVKWIADLHNGKVSINSICGEGTLVKVILPIL